MAIRHVTPHSFATNLFAVFLFHFAAFHGFVATVAAIVLTAFIVVVIITVAIPFILDRTAFSGRLSKVVGIDALALTRETAFTTFHPVGQNPKSNT